MPPLGAHMSIAGGYYRAVEAAAECKMDCVQLFTKNNNQWRAKPITDDDVAAFRRKLRELKIKRPLYERFGVTELWLVDPEIEEVQVYLVSEGFTDPVMRFDETGEYESTMFPGLVFQGEIIFKKPV